MNEQRGINQQQSKRPLSKGEILLNLEKEMITLHNASDMSRKLADEAKEKTYWASGMAEVHVPLE